MFISDLIIRSERLRVFYVLLKIKQTKISVENTLKKDPMMCIVMQGKLIATRFSWKPSLECLGVAHIG